MKLSVALSQRLGARTVEYAKAVERLGFDGAFVFDHLSPGHDPTRPSAEAVSTLGMIAATVPRIRVGSMVLRTSLREPQIARDIARTLAAIAPGRVVIGVGMGDKVSAQEMEAYGLGFPSLSDRLELLEETVDLVKNESVEMVVGGSHPGVAQIAQKADGWNLWEVNDTSLESAVGAHPKVSWTGRVRSQDFEGPQLAAYLRSMASTGCSEAILSVLPAGDMSALVKVAAQLR